MAAKRKIYTAEFKREAVSLITNHGYGVSEAARNLGLHANMPRKWKRTLGATGRTGLSRERSPEPGSGRTASVTARKQAPADGARHLEESGPFFRQRGELRVRVYRRASHEMAVVSIV